MLEPSREAILDSSDGKIESLSELSPDFGFLYSSPLLDHQGRPLPLLDHNAECLEVFAALRRAHVGLRAECDVATTRALRRLLTHGVILLHYCGHGLMTPLRTEMRQADAPQASGFSLVLEDGFGGAHQLTAEALGKLVAAGGHALQLVFVSACHSMGGGARSRHA